jgi:hypothetical protein
MGRKWTLLLGLSVLAVCALLLELRFVTGLGPRRIVTSAPSYLRNLSKSVGDSNRVRALNAGRYTNVIFLHHSVGEALIKQSDIRQSLTAAGIAFWDQGYNQAGLTQPDGSPAQYGYNIPNDNTDPDGLARIFSRPAFRKPWNALSGLLQHEVIAVKSCFPANLIRDEQHLAFLKSQYLEMRRGMDEHKDKLFLVVTTPPLNPAETDRGTAALARRMAEWLNSPEFLDGHPNIRTFDLYGRLAENDAAKADFGMLREDYRTGSDSHPNRLANAAVGPALAAFILESVRQRGGSTAP